MRPRIPESVFSESHDLRATMLAMVMAGCLWWFTWLQFVIRIYYGIPYYSDPAHALEYYEKVDAYSLSLPEMFFGLAVAASGLALC
jgi:hypothetical protein